MKLPPDVTYHAEAHLFTWIPRGVLDEKAVNKIIAFVGNEEARAKTPFDRFTDISLLEVYLNFKFVFRVALYRRLSYAGRAAVKSAFLVKSLDSVHYAKLHALLTDHSALRVRIFEERETAAKRLGVPIEVLG